MKVIIASIVDGKVKYNRWLRMKVGWKNFLEDTGFSTQESIIKSGHLLVMTLWNYTKGGTNNKKE